MYVGSIKCFFLKYYYNGRTPLLSIGPSWPFTLGLLTFALFALIYFLWMLTLLKLVDTLEESDDVQRVFGNYEISDILYEKLK